MYVFYSGKFSKICDFFSMLLPEFNPVQQPLLNEKVLRDKRKKLRETFERIIRLYERENPETYKELRKLELDYETKRGQLALYYDSVKVCFSVNFLFIYLLNNVLNFISLFYSDFLVTN